jgi:hypothetical protein
MTAALATRILAAITKHGGVVTFPGTTGGATYNPVTDTWSGGTPGAAATGRAIQKKDDPERFQAMGLTMANAITLLVAAEGLAVTPAPGMAFQWAGKTYTALAVEPMAPQGTALYYEMTGGL